MQATRGHSTNWTFVPKGALQSAESASEKMRHGYRFGFNGMEKDDEINGATGTSYTAEFWQYDPRIGRRWNLDPVDQISISNYAAFALNPIFYNDPYGDCPTCPEGASLGDTHEWGGSTFTYGESGWATELAPFEVVANGPSADLGSGEVGRGAYGGSFSQYKNDYGLSPDMSHFEASQWQEGALREWNTENGLPSNTPYEGSWDAWYKTTDYYRQDQAQAASGLWMFGHAMAYSMGVYALGGMAGASVPGLGLNPTLPSSAGFNAVPRYDNLRGMLMKDLNFVRAPGYYGRPNHQIWPQTTYEDVIMSGRINWHSPNNTWRISARGYFNGKPAEYQLGLRGDGGVIHNFIKPLE